MRSSSLVQLIISLVALACNQDRGLVPIEDSQLPSVPDSESPNASGPQPGVLGPPSPEPLDTGPAPTSAPSVESTVEGSGGMPSPPASTSLVPTPTASEPAPTSVPVPSDEVPAEAPAPTMSDAGAAPEPEPAPTMDPNGCTLAPIDPCTEGIPMLTGTQTVDGDMSDFCDVPVALLELSTAPLTIGDTSGLPHKAEVRLAWSAEALHVYAAVTDPNVMPEGTPNSWSGDSLDLFVAATTDTSGNLGDDGTPQLILAPPSTDGSREASAMRFPAQEQITSGYAALTTETGYAVELSYPWPGGASLAAGSAIRINFALNVRETDCTDTSDLNNCRQYYGAYTYTSPGSGPCDGYTLHSGHSAEPWCDNRTWCPATLE